MARKWWYLILYVVAVLSGIGLSYHDGMPITFFNVLIIVLITAAYGLLYFFFQNVLDDLEQMILRWRKRRKQ